MKYSGSGKVTRPGPRSTRKTQSELAWWQVAGWWIGGVAGIFAGTALTVSSFFYFLAARLGPLYNGGGESALLLLWVLPFAPVWGIATGGALVSGAMQRVAQVSERSRADEGWSHSALPWVYGGAALLLVPLIFWGGCAVLGFVLGVLVQLAMLIS
jgi:hypothetical protein